VVSSETPLRFFVNLVKVSESFYIIFLMSLKSSLASSEAFSLIIGNFPDFLNSFSAANPSIKKIVASPPSSTI
jgi:hypothetical protein